MGGMAYLAAEMTNTIANSSDPNATTKYEGSEFQIFFMFNAFTFIFAFGLAPVVAGAWQFIFGRRNLVLLWIIFASTLVFFIAGRIIRFTT